MYKILGILLLIFTACQAVTLNSQVIPTFHKYKELNSQFIKSTQDNQKEQNKKRELVEAYMYHEYTKALNILEKEYCLNPNKDVLNEFISVLIATKNSAYEAPSLVLGEIYICQPNSVLRNVTSLSKQNKNYIINTLDFGFKSATYNKESKITNYTELNDKLKSLKIEKSNDIKELTNTRNE